MINRYNYHVIINNPAFVKAAKRISQRINCRNCWKDLREECESTFSNRLSCNQIMLEYLIKKGNNPKQILNKLARRIICSCCPMYHPEIKPSCVEHSCKESIIKWATSEDYYDQRNNKNI